MIEQSMGKFNARVEKQSTMVSYLNADLANFFSSSDPALYFTLWSYSTPTSWLLIQKLVL
jgi:hypothetical protein